MPALQQEHVKSANHSPSGPDDLDIYLRLWHAPRFVFLASGPCNRQGLRMAAKSQFVYVRRRLGSEADRQILRSGKSA